VEEKRQFDESIVDHAPGTKEAEKTVRGSGIHEPGDDGAVEIEIEDGSISEEQSSDKKAEKKKAEEKKSEDHKEKKKDKTAKKADQKDKKKSVDALEVELKKAEDKAAEYSDKYQRLLAEFENARNRSAKEQSRMFDVGAKSVLEKLLPVVDNFERGIEVLSDEEKKEPFAQGVIKIYQQLMTVLEQIGVKPIEALGKEFNADFHNAVMHEEDEEMGDNLVSQEFQKGYMYKEDVLRHSMVKVVN
jgi:molecular chaperone GrpE